LRHVVLTSLALCCLHQLLRLLGSRLSLLADRRKAALRSLLGSEAALQGLTGSTSSTTSTFTSSTTSTFVIIRFVCRWSGRCAGR
jgi:hypothetical protein